MQNEEMKEIISDKIFEEKVRIKNHKLNVFFVVRLILIVIVFSSLALYLLSPLSTMKNMELDGNVRLNSDDVYSVLNISSKTSLYSINKKKSEEILNAHPLIRNANIQLNPFGCKIGFEEAIPGAKYENDIYNSFGEFYSIDDQNNNLIIKDYLSRFNNNYAVLINQPDAYKKNDLALLMNFTGFTNLNETIINYVDINNLMTSSKIFDFYYKLDDNFNYLRVELNYDNQYEINDYYHFLSKEVIIDTLHKNIDQSNIEKFETEINGTQITYYNARLKLIRDNGKIKGDFTYLIKNEV